MDEPQPLTQQSILMSYTLSYVPLTELAIDNLLAPATSHQINTDSCADLRSKCQTMQQIVKHNNQKEIDGVQQMHLLE